MRSLIDAFVNTQPFGPPLSMEDLSDLSDRLIADHTLDPGFKGWIMVEINNGVWRETVASIPYNKRILLLPKCLSHSANCQADVDEFGLLCHRCNHCSIPNLQDRADDLGMMSIVAEGFTSVISLIENRVVDTVIGVGCLDSLEKAFPLLINNAVPGLAIPLNTAGCKDTEVDYNYVDEMISMQSDREVYLLDYDHLKSTLNSWFSSENLDSILTHADDPTSSIAREWIGGEGKRWRPYLLAATYMALSGEKEIPQEVELAAVAVECFHKASLVHDDIQDNDTMRYGKQTVNAAYGVPMAINVGDILLGEGYRLLTGCGKMELVKVIADSHVALCKGQGIELAWSVSPHPLTMDFVLDIFCHKTVPAFDVSLIMGLICAGDDPELREILHRYSRALGIAYQLQDDIEDFETDDPVALRPSAVLAALCELQPDEEFIRTLLYHEEPKGFLYRSENKPLLNQALERVRQMVEQYHREALDVLHDVTNIELKRLLFRVTKRILK
ncbi:polyprenyl synthetase family protein [Parabacteroides sp. PFB2-10]|uniref:polyprenyl synthetase family protein n=1 Tax=Parabacteroides sp. PFB2-10 TaxID=1742405 RepID=UPI0024751B12|nr:polyprenyl synthetase family protein [Parabacteroides sp. PFB2-10]